jgi:hypothetical protein
MRRLLASLLVCVSSLVAVAHPAAAAEFDEILERLRADRLYVSPDSTVSPDRGIVRSALAAAEDPTYVAVVSQAEADAQEMGIDGLTLRLVEGLDDPEAMVLVITDGELLQAAGGAETGTAPIRSLDRIIETRLDQPFGPETLTAAIQDFAGYEPPPESEPATTRRTVGVVGLAIVLALAVGAWLQDRARRRAWAAEDAAAEDAQDDQVGDGEAYPDDGPAEDQEHERRGGWGGVVERDRGKSS